MVTRTAFFNYMYLAKKQTNKQKKQDKHKYRGINLFDTKF